MRRFGITFSLDVAFPLYVHEVGYGFFVVVCVFLAKAHQQQTLSLIPLVCKVTAVGNEPLQHKGGVLPHIYKGRGARTHTASFRNALLESVGCNGVNNAARMNLMATAGMALKDTQCGHI